MILLHKNIQIFERSLISLDDTLFDKSEILDGNNQYTLLLTIFITAIGRMGGNSIKKITPRKFFLDKINLEIIFTCNMLYLSPCLIIDDPD